MGKIILWSDDSEHSAVFPSHPEKCQLHIFKKVKIVYDSFNSNGIFHQVM